MPKGLENHVKQVPDEDGEPGYRLRDVIEALKTFVPEPDEDTTFH